MPSENILETYAWLRAAGFMAPSKEFQIMSNETTSTDDADEETIRARGLADGKAVGSWVIDGNTTPETARTIYDAIEACDWDGGPVLQLGEWADDPSWEDILSDEGIDCDDDTADDLWTTYQDAWYEGMIAEVQRAARLAMPMRVELTSSDDDDGMVTVYCFDQEQARHDQSVSLDGQSSRWECPSDMPMAYASLCNFYDLAKALTDAGYEVDDSEYSAPNDEDLAYWAYRNTCENDGTDILDRDEWLETRAVGHTWRSEDGVQCDWRDEDDTDPDTGAPSRCTFTREEH